MKKYLICTESGASFHAASKARKDAELIAQRMGYELFRFQGGRSAKKSVYKGIRFAWDGVLNWLRFIREIDKDSLVLLQYPHYPIKSAFLLRWMIPLSKWKNRLNYIALVHDLDSLRNLHGSGALYSDQCILPLFDAIICHNDNMKAYLTKQGIAEEKLISLGIFDYLTKESHKIHTRLEGIAVAGNLSHEKCAYILEWMRMDWQGTPIHLYGNGFEHASTPNYVQMHGIVPPEELPRVIEGGFGLVWDGPSEKNCSGFAGEYLRYNNPHKLSLYLASGIPVIIWEEAACAKFVQDAGVGLLIKSINEIEKIIASLSDEQYQQMLERVEKIGKAIREGRFLFRALKKAETIKKL